LPARFGKRSVIDLSIARSYYTVSYVTCTFRDCAGAERLAELD